MSDGTQVKDIAKKEGYPNFKAGVKLKLKENITETVSLDTEGQIDRALATAISQNMKDEADAIGYYNDLLNYDALVEEDRKQIEEFISDEKNHLEGLQKMLVRYDGNIPTSQD